MPVCLCLCTFIEIRKGTKNLNFVMCTVVYIGLGKTPVTIWTIGSLENWGNHWRKWTILRSFRATLVTLPDCIGGVILTAYNLILCENSFYHQLPHQELSTPDVFFHLLNVLNEYSSHARYDLKILIPVLRWQTSYTIIYKWF